MARLGKRERIYQAVREVMGDRYREGEDTRVFFYGRPGRRSGGVVIFSEKLEELLSKIQRYDEESEESIRSATIDALRRDPRLNGGKQRLWKNSLVKKYIERREADAQVRELLKLRHIATDAGDISQIDTYIERRSLQIFVEEMVNLRKIPDAVKEQLGLLPREMDQKRAA